MFYLLLGIAECADPTKNVCDVANHALCVEEEFGYSCKCPDVGYQPILNPSDPCLRKSQHRPVPWQPTPF